MTLDQAKHLLAGWRREGKGVWYITFVVEGYDDDFTYVHPGRFGRRFAIGLATVACAKELGVSSKYIVIKEVRLES